MKEETSNVIETSVVSRADDSTTIEMPATEAQVGSTPVESWNHRGSASCRARGPAALHPTHNTLRRAWDDYDAYLFEIDGTLLHCRDAVHYFAFCDALSFAAGRPVNLDGVPVQGKIDPGILRDAFHSAGVPEQQWRPHLPALLHRMGAHVDAHTADFEIEVLPVFFENLSLMKYMLKLLVVGTGNLERIGWAKLTHCGLRGFFTLGGFSDRYEHRGDMIADAVAATRALLHDPDAAILVLGDTPGDIAAARFTGVDVLAVATGIYPAEQLTAADLVLTSLVDLPR